MGANGANGAMKPPEMPPRVRLITPVGPPIPAPVQATIDGLAPAIEFSVDAIPPLIQPVSDTVAASVEALRPHRMAAIPGALRLSVQTPVDTGPSPIQAAVQVIAAPIHALFDAVSMPLHMGGRGVARSRARGAQQA